MLVNFYGKNLLENLDSTDIVLDDETTLVLSHGFMDGFTMADGWHIPPVSPRDRVLVLVRNPWDTMVSYYQHFKYRGMDGRGNGVLPPDFPLSDFIRSNVGINQWCQHERMFRDPPMGMTVNYRSLVGNPRELLEDVVDFVSPRPKASWSQYNYAIEASTVDELRKIQHPHFQPIDPDNPESGKVRRAKVGGFIDYMNDEDIKYILDALDPFQWQDNKEMLEGSEKVWSKQ
jgi:hypothetical protein